MANTTKNSKFKIQNFFWPLLIIALGVIALLQALEVFPPAISDLLGRSWPLLLVIVGLAFALEQVRPLQRWAWLVALVVSGALIAGVIAVAYTGRSVEERQERVVTFSQTLEEDVVRLRVEVEGLETAIEISPSLADEPVISAEFTGSLESEVRADYTLEGGVAIFTVYETRQNAIPLLEAVGRGRLTVELPPGVPLDLSFMVADGRDVSLNLDSLDLATLSVDAVVVDMLLLTLPARSLDVPGSVVVGRGDLTVYVPEELGLQIFSNRRPQTQLLVGDLRDETLFRSENFDDFEAQTELNLNVFGGTISVEDCPSCGGVVATE